MDALRPFLPRLYHAVLPAPTSPDAPLARPTAPLALDMRAAALFADVVSFTAIMERLSAKGAGGSEALKVALDAYFSGLVRLVRSFGGDVLFFAGDALLALFPVDAAAGVDDCAAVSLAVACARLIRDAGPGILAMTGGDAGATFNAADSFTSSSSRIKFKVRVGVAVGPVTLSLVGGSESSTTWHLIGDGPAIVDAIESEAAAAPSQVVLSAAAAKFFPCDSGSVLPANVRIAPAYLPEGEEAMRLEAAYQSREALHFPADGADSHVDRQEALRALLPPPLSLPGTLIAEVQAQMRPIAAVFVAVRCGSSLADRHRALAALHTDAARHGGAINKVMRDDKGLTVLAVFGLPLLDQDNTAERAVLFGLSARGQGDVGVAKGEAYCGVFGPVERREYAVLGDCVNTAARFMQQAQADVRVDHAIAQAVAGNTDKIELEELAPVRVKGKSSELRIYRAIRSEAPRQLLLSHGDSQRGSATTMDTFRSGSDPGSMLSRARDLPLVGRATEILRLKAFLQAVADSTDDPECRTLVIAGPAGIGKTRLVGQAFAAATNLRLLSASCQYEDRTSPFALWRTVIGPILTSMTASRQRLDVSVRFVESFLQSLGHDERETALLKPFLPDLEPSAEARAFADSIPSEAHAARAMQIVEDIMAHASRSKQILVAVDDLHYADTASLQLIAQVSAAAPLVSWILSARSEKMDALRADLFGKLEGSVEQLMLGPLPEDGVAGILTALFDVRTVAADVVNVVARRADGVPSAVVLIGQQLAEQRAVIVAGGQCTLSNSVTADELLESKTFSLKHANLQRLDGLTARAQVVLRFASVIGSRFDSTDVEYLCAMVGETADVRAEINRLYLADILKISKETFGTRQLRCTFSQESMREAAYETMLASQRQELHGAMGTRLAGILESDPGSEITHASIARHFGLCDRERDRAIKFAFLAGADAQVSQAFREAIFWFNKVDLLLDAAEEALSDDDIGDPAPVVRSRKRESIVATRTATMVDTDEAGAWLLVMRLRMLTQRGSCYSRLGDHGAANASYFSFLRRTHAEIPASRFSGMVEMLRLLWFGNRVVDAIDKGTVPKLPRRTSRLRRWARWIEFESPQEYRDEIIDLTFATLGGIGDSSLADPDVVRDIIVSMRHFTIAEGVAMKRPQPLTMVGLLYGMVLRNPRRLESVRAYLVRVVEENPQSEHMPMVAWFSLANGRFAEARALFPGILEVARANCMSRVIRDTEGQRVVLGLWTGQFDEALAGAEGQYGEWSAHRDMTARVWGLLGHCKVHGDRGDMSKLHKALTELRELRMSDPVFFETNPLILSEYEAIASVAYGDLGELVPAFECLNRLAQFFAANEAGQPNYLWVLERIAILLRRVYERNDRFAAQARPLFAPIRRELARIHALWPIAAGSLALATAVLRKGRVSIKHLAKAEAHANKLGMRPLRAYARAFNPATDIRQSALDEFRDMGMTLALGWFT